MDNAYTYLLTYHTRIDFQCSKVGYEIYIIKNKYASKDNNIT